VPLNGRHDTDASAIDGTVTGKEGKDRKMKKMNFTVAGLWINSAKWVEVFFDSTYDREGRMLMQCSFTQ
jgi:hypothetical protein